MARPDLAAAPRGSRERIQSARRWQSALTWHYLTPPEACSDTYRRDEPANWSPGRSLAPLANGRPSPSHRRGYGRTCHRARTPAPPAVCHACPRRARLAEPTAPCQRRFIPGA
ncbi:hypothetical protein AAFF_G00285440 [Aldrovandia affinis]|uniref:Uncharacterized protein n=1 Tax=Aldrovandia affinis TaxID=143900 RepID=A0AAD7TAD9_9TELE|nr:hypothetical protein AAFF_G00285440 [Aldrovandia affinis]